MVDGVRNKASELGSTPSVTYNRLFLKQDLIFSSEGVPILRVMSGSLRSRVLERFRNYCGLIKVARIGFPWEKTTTGDVASVYTDCETALTEKICIANPQ